MDWLVASREMPLVQDNRVSRYKMQSLFPDSVPINTSTGGGEDSIIFSNDGVERRGWEFDVEKRKIYYYLIKDEGERKERFVLVKRRQLLLYIYIYVCTTSFLW